jgi:hypothetical protein
MARADGEADPQQGGQARSRAKAGAGVHGRTARGTITAACEQPATRGAAMNDVVDFRGGPKPNEEEQLRRIQIEAERPRQSL